MIDLSRLFLVPFDDKEISFGELRLFTDDHLGRLRNQNAAGSHMGMFTGMLALTQAKFNTFAGLLGTRAVAASGHERDTMAMNAAMKVFKDLVRRREGRVKDKFGKPSPQYEDFFPQGLTAYNEATLETAETMMIRMVTISTRHVAQVGQDMVDEFIAAKAAFVSARGDQTGQSGSVADAIRERDTARDALAEQLMDNLYDIAKMFKRQPARCADFFNQSLLREDESAEEEEEPQPPAPPAPPA